MNNINIAEILKDCPKGTKLYSPLCGECELVSVENNYIKVRDNDEYIRGFLSNGRVNMNGECLLFPSKENRDWSKFRRPLPFKDGDIVATSNGRWIGITTGGIPNEFIPTYCVLNSEDELYIYLNEKVTWQFHRLATEEEKHKLFDAIKANGYKWNEETKTLERLIVPKFKVGDTITPKDFKGKNRVINAILNEEYNLFGGGKIPFSDQDYWNLVPNKFDITTLKPFDKVLVRDNSTQKWHTSLFDYQEEGEYYSYCCLNGIGYAQCIPYEKNKHLLGTTNDCSEYYKTWE